MHAITANKTNNIGQGRLLLAVFLFPSASSNLITFVFASRSGRVKLALRVYCHSVLPHSALWQLGFRIICSPPPNPICCNTIKSLFTGNVSSENVALVTVGKVEEMVTLPEFVSKSEWG